MTKNKQPSFDFDSFNKQNDEKSKSAKRLEQLAVGLTLEEVVELCRDNDIRVRITVENGKPRVITMDYRLDRINVEVVNEIVTKVRVG